MAVAAGQYHSVAAKNDGTVVAWGYNNNGQLGDGTTTQRNTAVAVIGASNVVAIAAGTHTLTLKGDGNVWATGLNTNGQLGVGTNASRTTLASIVGFTFAGQVARSTFGPEGGQYFNLKA